MTLGFVVRGAGRRLRRSTPFLLVLTGAFALVTGLGAAAVVLHRESDRATARLAESSHVVAYLDAGLSEERAQALVVAFGRLAGVIAVRELDGRAALGELRETLSQVGIGASQRDDMLSGIEADFLPRSIEITLAPGGDLGARAREVAARLGRLEGVGAVDAMTDGLARVAVFGAWADQMAFLFSAVAGLFAIALWGGLVVRERGQHREMAEALHLLGAAPLTMWLPLGLVDALAAVVGGAVGIVVGTRLTAAAFAIAPSAGNAGGLGTGFGHGEGLLALALLAGVGLVTGRLSLPRPRGALAP